MSFDELLMQTKDGREAAFISIFEMYKPLLVKNAIINGVFCEDLYQELSITLWICVRRFRIL